jgi:SAM-dependent methyltransferase
VSRYDEIGRTYARTRATDPRIAAAIWAGLGDARTVLNVGAGTGNYEPPDRDVTAVEPSSVMIAQRAEDAAPVVQASADSLPFEDDSFDAAMAVLTIHHWGDWHRGIDEMRRVAGRVVVFSWDPSFARRLWVTAEYFPFVGDEETTFPSLADQVGAVRARSVTTVPVPHDCQDGFYGAYWRRPEAYLDPEARAGISVLASRTAEELEPGLEQLRADLDSGAWAERHAGLLEREDLDLGYRLLVA